MSHDALIGSIKRTLRETVKFLNPGVNNTEQIPFVENILDF